MSQPYQECPRFNTCNVNKCPLDSEVDLKNTITGDEKCTMEKNVRFKIGNKYPNLLKYQGLSKREWAGKQLSESLRQVKWDTQGELVATARG